MVLVFVYARMAVGSQLKLKHVLVFNYNLRESIALCWFMNDMIGNAEYDLQATKL